MFILPATNLIGLFNGASALKTGAREGFGWRSATVVGWGLIALGLLCVVPIWQLAFRG